MITRVPKWAGNAALEELTGEPTLQQQLQDAAGIFFEKSRSCETGNREKKEPSQTWPPTSPTGGTDINVQSLQRDWPTINLQITNVPALEQRTTTAATTKSPQRRKVESIPIEGGNFTICSAQIGTSTFVSETALNKLMSFALRLANDEIHHD
jgi:hypothetical protein